MYYPEDLKDMYSFFTNSRFLPATTLPELSPDCLNSFQILQIIQNFLPNELRTFFKEKLKFSNYLSSQGKTSWNLRILCSNQFQKKKIRTIIGGPWWTQIKIFLIQKGLLDNQNPGFCMGWPGLHYLLDYID